MVIPKCILSLIYFLVCWGPLQMHAQETVDLIVWAGQSNAQGFRGDAAQYPEDVNGLDGNVLFNYHNPQYSQGTNWSNLGPQYGVFSQGHFGPEISFARRLLNLGINPAIFKHTQSATSLKEDWLGPGENGLYDQMAEQLLNSIDQLESEGFIVNPLAIVWIQGESDAKLKATKEEYGNALSALLSDLTNNVLKNPETLVVLGVDEQFPAVKDNPGVLNAFMSLAIENNRYRFSSMYGFPKDDYTHLTPEGLVFHGEHIADVFANLRNNSFSTSSCQKLGFGETRPEAPKPFWGQFFKPQCSGPLVSFSFESGSTVPVPATFTLIAGSDCKGQVIFSEEFDSIQEGSNQWTFTEEIELIKEQTYYFEIRTQNNLFWEMLHHPADTVIGFPRTFLSGESHYSCETDMRDIDLNFGYTIGTGILSVTGMPSNAINPPYPNPCSGIIKFTPGLPQGIGISLFNGNGELIKADILYSQDSTTIDFGEHPPGIYCIQLLHKQQSQYFKVHLK